MLRCWSSIAWICASGNRFSDLHRRRQGIADDVITQIVERTDGVPLFVEELTKSVLESGILREEEGRYVLTAPCRRSRFRRVCMPR